MKRVLILTTSYGQGHMATAQAISEGILSVNKKAIDVEIVDFTDIISSLLNKTTKRMYLGTAKYAPSLYKLFFELTDTETTSKAINELNYIFSREKILNFFIDKSPDLIICNSPHWQYIASLARQEEFKNVPMVSVITDMITIHASWVIGDPDYYLVANKETGKSLRAIGVPNKKIKILGYPVKDTFYKRTNKQSIINQLDIDKNQKIILLLASGLKPSFVQSTLDNLDEIDLKTKTIVITGRDDKLFNKLKSFKHRDIILINWTTNLADFIMTSHVVITKAGGSSIMECIVSRKPVVISKIIPGQEEGNAEYISKNKLGMVALSPPDIAKAIYQIINHYEIYTTNLREHTRNGSIRDISKFLISLIN